MSNLEPRLERVEIGMGELRQMISELRSSVATLADLAGIHESQWQESMRRHEAAEARAAEDRTLMLNMISEIRQQATADRQQAAVDRQRSDAAMAEFRQQATADRQRADSGSAEFRQQTSADRQRTDDLLAEFRQQTTAQILEIRQQASADRQRTDDLLAEFRQQTAEAMAEFRQQATADRAVMAALMQTIAASLSRPT